MIKIIKQSDLDRQYLASRPYNAIPINIDFSQKIVNKPWGKEYLMFNNNETEVWNLFIKHQRSTSTHCHPNKRTALIVLKGRALFSTLNESWELMPLDTMIVDAGTFHSTQCISSDGLQLIELETPPMKHDLVRLEDKYGRAEKGYEGSERMEFDSENIRFNNSLNSVKNICNNEMCIKTINNTLDLNNTVKGNTVLVAILGGVISTFSGIPLYSSPNIINREELNETKCLYNNVTALMIGR